MAGAYKDLVIFLPGIGGSSLVRGGELLWGASWSVVLSALRAGHLDALVMSPETGELDLGDDIAADAVLGTFSVIPGLWKIEGYHGFCQRLCTVVGLTAGRNFFSFPYDWRRDNRVSARRLKAFADEQLRAWRESSNNPDAKIVLIGHSMGGLVARYYIECLEGWRDIARLFTIGTPHRGSLNALGFLANGFARKIGPVPVDATRPLRSFPSVYQLLPTYRCIEGPTALKRVHEVDGALPNAAAAADGLAFHREISDAVERNRMEDGYPHQYLTALASARQPTFQSARMEGAWVSLLSTFEGQDLGGDGTVPRVSAVPLELGMDQAFNVWGKHSALCNQVGVYDHLTDALLARRIAEDRFRADGSRPEVQFALEDVYEADQPFEISAEVAGIYEQTLTVASETAGGDAGPSTTLHRDGSRLVGKLSLPQGAWRITVSGRRSAGVSDVVFAI